jgi:hypothetical protein
MMLDEHPLLPQNLYQWLTRNGLTLQIRSSNDSIHPFSLLHIRPPFS